jgi:hypothetical protein
MKRSLSYLLCSLFLISGLVGCAEATPAPKSVSHGFFSPRVPADFTPVETSLNTIIVLCVIGIGIGVAMYFFLPTPNHSLALAIAGTAGTVEGAAIFLKLVIPFLLPAVSILGVIAVTIGAYEIYAYRAQIETELNPAAPAPSLASATTKVAVAIQPAAITVPVVKA